MRHDNGASSTALWVSVGWSRDETEGWLHNEAMCQSVVLREDSSPPPQPRPGSASSTPRAALYMCVQVELSFIPDFQDNQHCVLTGATTYTG